MSAIRKSLAVVSALLSILAIFLAIGAAGLTLSTYRPSTAFDRVAPWLAVAVLICLSFVLMRFSGRNLHWLPN